MRRLWYGEAIIKVNEWELIKWKIDQTKQRNVSREALIQDVEKKTRNTFPALDRLDDGPVFDRSGFAG
tara:strand:- start:93 stop:296 length:204 start_codon:yes stop_codon:yes gene_type:complete